VLEQHGAEVVLGGRLWQFLATSAGSVRGMIADELATFAFAAQNVVIQGG
jgi:hypothetical protein